VTRALRARRQALRPAHAFYVKAERWRVNTSTATARALRDEATLLAALSAQGANATAVPRCLLLMSGDPAAEFFTLAALVELTGLATQLQLRRAVRAVAEIADLADVSVTLHVASVQIDLALPAAAPSTVSEWCPRSCYACDANALALRLGGPANAARAAPAPVYTNPLVTSGAAPAIDYDGGVQVIDCTGIPGGGLIMDSCEVCDGDNVSCTDCMGIPYGPYFEDECGACDLSLRDDCLADCALVWGGAGSVDVCGVCGGDASLCSDCSGVPFGGLKADPCGTCDDEAANDCRRDCFTVWGGGAAFDGCGVCAGDNSTCSDCSGALFGARELDECATCDADVGNNCVRDCDGVWGTGRVLDRCGVCDGPNACVGCDNVSFSGLVMDRCFVCGGNDTCVGCDNVTHSGTVRDDVCGLCGPPGRLKVLDFFAAPKDGKLGVPRGPFVTVDHIDDCTRMCLGNGTACVATVFDEQYRCYLSAAGEPADVAYGSFFHLRRLAHAELPFRTTFPFRPKLDGVRGPTDDDIMDPAQCVGCDAIPLSGLKDDACFVCDGDNSTCNGCDGVPASGLRKDSCGVCDGDNATCRLAVPTCAASEYEASPLVDNCTGNVTVPWSGVQAYVGTTAVRVNLSHAPGIVPAGRKYSWCADNRVCAAYTLCLPLPAEFERVPPTPTSDRACQAVRPPCGAGQWEIPPTPTSDRVCADLTVCSLGEYQTAPPTPLSDRVCAALTVCDGDGEWEIEAPTPTTDRVCSAITRCARWEYIFEAPTADADTVCRALTNCSAGEYARVAATTFSDTDCEALTACEGTPSYEIEFTPPTMGAIAGHPTAVTDRVCRPTVCTFEWAIGDFNLTWCGRGARGRRATIARVLTLVTSKHLLEASGTHRYLLIDYVRQVVPEPERGPDGVRPAGELVRRARPRERRDGGHGHGHRLGEHGRDHLRR
jgi:hypothetical protein